MKIRSPVEATRRSFGGQASLSLSFTLDLSAQKPGEASPFEQALHVVFGPNWTRKEANWLLRQMTTAVSKAIVADGGAAFPLEVAMIRGNARKSEEREAYIINVDFRGKSAA